MLKWPSFLIKDNNFNFYSTDRNYLINNILPFDLVYTSLCCQEVGEEKLTYYYTCLIIDSQPYVIIKNKEQYYEISNPLLYSILASYQFVYKCNSLIIYIISRITKYNIFHNYNEIILTKNLDNDIFLYKNGNIRKYSQKNFFLRASIVNDEWKLPINDTLMLTEQIDNINIDFNFLEIFTIIEEKKRFYIYFCGLRHWLGSNYLNDPLHNLYPYDMSLMSWNVYPAENINLSTSVNYYDLSFSTYELANRFLNELVLFYINK